MVATIWEYNGYKILGNLNIDFILILSKQVFLIEKTSLKTNLIDIQRRTPCHNSIFTSQSRRWRIAENRRRTTSWSNWYCWFWSQRCHFSSKIRFVYTSKFAKSQLQFFATTVNDVEKEFTCEQLSISLNYYISRIFRLLKCHKPSAHICQNNFQILIFGRMISFSVLLEKKYL